MADEKINYALTHGTVDIKEVLEANLGGDTINQFDLDRVKMPSAGQLQWTVPGLEGNQLLDSIDGVIVHWQEKRTYWEKDMAEGGGGEPDCRSEDAKIGMGTPSGDCSECVFSKFGSHKSGFGQACKLARHLFIMRETDLLPIVVSLSPASIGPIKKYFLRLASNGVSVHHVETTLKLNSAKSKSGIEYSVVDPALSKRLDTDMITKFDSFIAEIKPSLQKVSVRDDN